MLIILYNCLLQDYTTLCILQHMYEVGLLMRDTSGKGCCAGVRCKSLVKPVPVTMWLWPTLSFLHIMSFYSFHASLLDPQVLLATSTWTPRALRLMCLSAGLHIFGAFIFAQLMIFLGLASRQVFLSRGKAETSWQVCAGRATSLHYICLVFLFKREEPHLYWSH